MTLKGGTSQACAACKYQRRRCLPECQLAPYFPADQPKMFQNAHRLFGVSNILKILKCLDPSEQPEAMRSIIYESDVRNKYPVLGCYGIIYELESRVRLAQEELQMIKSQIALCKMQQCQNGDNQDLNSSLRLGMGIPNNNVNGTMLFENGGFEQNDMLLGQQCCNDGIQPQDHHNLDHHIEGMHTFLDGIDEKQCIIDSKSVQGYESVSSDSDETMKKAAARFSLKNII